MRASYLVPSIKLARQPTLQRCEPSRPILLLPRMPAFQIRPAQPSDAPAINAVLTAAFPTDLESRLVSLLTNHHKDVVSLVASIDKQTVGHIVFSPATSSRSTVPAGLGLAPLAVLPSHQRQGIGSALIAAGLNECRTLSAPWVVVLGEPAYYGRFGFIPASRFGLTGEFGGEDAFQILLLDEQQRPPPGSHIEYAAEFRSSFC